MSNSWGELDIILHSLHSHGRAYLTLSILGLVRVEGVLLELRQGRDLSKTSLQFAWVVQTLFWV